MEQQKYVSVEEAASLFSLEQPSSSKPGVGFNMQNLLLSATVCEPLTSCPLSSALGVWGDDNLLGLQGVLFAWCFKGISGLNQKHLFLTAAIFSLPFCLFLCCFFYNTWSYMQVITFKEYYLYHNQECQHGILSLCIIIQSLHDHMHSSFPSVVAWRKRTCDCNIFLSPCFSSYNSLSPPWPSFAALTGRWRSWWYKFLYFH